MRLVVAAEVCVRVSGDGEVDNVVETSALGLDALHELVTRVATEAGESGDFTLYDALMAEHFPPVEGDDGDSGQSYEEDEYAAWDPAGLVAVKQIYPEGNEYHGMPGLAGPADTWKKYNGEPLEWMGIDPAGQVSSVELWRPRYPNTHYEVGALIIGVYTKFDFSATGYRLIYGATQPAAGEYFSGCSTYNINVTAGDLYGTFLQVAATNGPYDMETNDCERFAEDLCSALGGALEDEGV